jgi:hypothetical protein
MNSLFRFNSSFTHFKLIPRSSIQGQSEGRKCAIFTRLTPVLIGFYFVSFVAFLNLAFIHQANANEARPGEVGACVICNDPGKVYQCTFKQSSYQPDTSGQTDVSRQPEVTGQSPTVNIKGLQFACIQEIAQYGGHAQCAAVRKSFKDCNGEVYQLKNSASVEQILIPATPKPEQELQESNVEPSKKEQPTLVGETQKTYKKTTKTVKKTFDKTSNTVKKTYDKTSNVVKKSVKSVGQGIGDAASTTYECLTSFFTKCGK